MKATVEISMYPLTEKYAEVVTDFILKVRTRGGLTIETNGMSTQIFGEYDRIMEVLTEEMKKVFEEERAMFVMKVGKGELKSENLPSELRV